MSKIKLTESGGKYFYDGTEYTLDFEGNGIKVFIDKDLGYCIITDNSLKTITALYTWEGGNFAFMAVDDKI